MHWQNYSGSDPGAEGTEMGEDEEIISYEEQSTDGWQYSLRPRRLSEYIGQDRVKSNLSKFIQAALSRGEALDHVLLYGPPGLGKTTLAGIIANEMGANFRQTSAPAIERQGGSALPIDQFTGTRCSLHR